MGLGQNDIVLSFFFLAKTTSFCISFVQNDVVLLPSKTKRRRFTTPPAQKRFLPCSSFHFAALWGMGGGREGRRPLVASVISLDVGGGGNGW